MTVTRTEPRIDVNIPRFNQAMVALLTGTAFVGRWPWLVAITFTALVVSVVGGPRLAPFTRLYQNLVDRRLRGPRQTEPAAPPRFAQQVGTGILAVALGAFAAGWTGVGWSATLLVATLAALAATTRVCVGCLVYERWVRR